MLLSLFVSGLVGIAAYFIADRVIGNRSMTDSFIKAGLFGKDLNKTSERRVYVVCLCLADIDSVAPLQARGYRRSVRFCVSSSRVYVHSGAFPASSNQPGSIQTCRGTYHPPTHPPSMHVPLKQQTPGPVVQWTLYPWSTAV